MSSKIKGFFGNENERFPKDPYHLLLLISLHWWGNDFIYAAHLTGIAGDYGDTGSLQHGISLHVQERVRIISFSWKLDKRRFTVQLKATRHPVEEELQ